MAKDSRGRDCFLRSRGKYYAVMDGLLLIMALGDAEDVDMILLSWGGCIFWDEDNPRSPFLFKYCTLVYTTT